MTTSQPVDLPGLQTLELFATATRFNQWLFEDIAKFCSGEILEIGSGTGNISKLLLEQFDAVTISDPHTRYCNILEKRFQNNSHLKGIFKVDLSVVDFEKNYPQLLNKFDAVVASNVIEHIKDDALAIKNCKKMLRQNGRLIILVPAFQFFYNSFDKELGHFKRYNKKNLGALLQAQSMEVQHTQYFNFVGIAGWWLMGSVLKKKIIPRYQLNFYNKLVPIFRLIDKLINRAAGLSVIAVAKC